MDCEAHLTNSSIAKTRASRFCFTRFRSNNATAKQSPTKPQLLAALDLRRLLRLFLILLISLSNTVYSCGQEIPIEVKWEFNKEPTETEVGYLMILAPLKHEGWSLGGVQFYKEQNTIPIMKYVSEEEFPGKALFQITATLAFLKGTRFTVSYTPDPVQQKDGSFVFMPCLHTQDVEVKI